MPGPDDDEDEDFLDDLPPLGDLSADDDEGLSPEELGLSESTEDADDDETVGLDDSTGLLDEASLFTLDLPPSEAADEDEVDEIPMTEGVGAEDEYGWTDDEGSTGDDRWDPAEIDLPPMTALGAEDDGGEEGVEDDFDLGGGDDDDAAPHLPVLLLDEDGDDEPIDLGLSFDLPGDIAALPPRLPDVEVERLLDLPTRDVVLAEVRWAATADGIYAGAQRREAAGLEGEPASIAACRGVLLVATSEGAFRSEDRARTFERVEALGAGPFELVAEREGPIWACGPTGRLQRSDDLGLTWSPPLLLTRVVAVTAPGEGVVTLSAPESAPTQVAASADGGARWAAYEAPPLAAADDRGYSLAVSGIDAAVASVEDEAGPWLSEDRGGQWRRVPGLPPATALLLRREEGQLALYAAHASGDGYAVARYRPGVDGGSGVLLETAGFVHCLVDEGDGAILVASEDGLYRLSVGGSR